MCHPLLVAWFESLSAVRGHYAAFLRIFGTHWVQNVPIWVDTMLLVVGAVTVGIPLSVLFIASIVAPKWAEEKVQKWGPTLNTWSTPNGVVMLVCLVVVICLIEGISRGRQAESLIRLQSKIEDFITLSKTPNAQ